MLNKRKYMVYFEQVNACRYAVTADTIAEAKAKAARLWRAENGLPTIEYMEMDEPDIITRLAESVDVDSGMIIVCDMDYLKAHPLRKDADLSYEWDIPKGLYIVKWGIARTWHGSINGCKELRMTSGKLCVVDPGYCIGGKGNEWIDWLHKVDHGRAMSDSRAFIIQEMGGDGSFDVKLTFTPMGD